MGPTEKDALYLVLYSMIYVPDKLSSQDIFSENFCYGFRAKFDESAHADIKVALSKVIDNPDYPYDEILPMLSTKYSRQDIYYYLTEFYTRLKDCS